MKSGGCIDRQANSVEPNFIAIRVLIGTVSYQFAGGMA
jgi:hypothetical protein